MKQYKNMKKDKLVLDQFHYHEATERAYIFGGMVNEHLITHPVIKKHKKLKKMAKKVGQLLANIYQLASNLEFTKFPNGDTTIE